MERDVVVVGGGVVGLTTGVVLAERGWRVRVWTRDDVTGTTSAVAGALWWPYHIEPQVSARAWALESLTVYRELAARGEGGVRMAEGVLGETSLAEVEWLAGAAPGLRESTPDEYPVGRGSGRGCRWSTWRCICRGCGGGWSGRAGRSRRVRWPGSRRRTRLWW